MRWLTGTRKTTKARRPGRLLLLARRARRLGRPALYGAGALLVAAGATIAWRIADPGRAVGGIGPWIVTAAAANGLAVERITVEGRRHATTDSLLAATGLSRGTPMLGFSPAEVRARLEASPWVAEAAVQRRFPDHVHIVVTEREPFAMWQRDGRFAVIDRLGRVIVSDAAQVAGFAGLPLVVGAGAAEFAAPLIDALARFTIVRQRTEAAVRVGQRRWNLRLASGTDILLPEGAEEAAIERLEKMHAESGLLDRQLASVDMRMPDRMVLRPLPGAVPEPAPIPGARPQAARRPT